MDAPVALPRITLAELQAQDTATFAYGMPHAPKPEVKVMHGEAGDTIAWGLAKRLVEGGYMAPGTEIKEVAKLIEIGYSHRPDQTFTIDAPELVHVHAPHVRQSINHPGKPLTQSVAPINQSTSQPSQSINQSVYPSIIQVSN